MFVVFMILIHGLFAVSQSHFTVEVDISKRSVLLPCQIRFVSEVTAVTWSRAELGPSLVHKHVKTSDGGGKEQNQRYRGRTSMRSNALKSGDLSLTLSSLRISDRGSYTCTITKNEEDVKVNEIQLQVKVNAFQYSNSVEMYVGATALLPCLVNFTYQDITVVWSRSDLSPSTVHLHPQGEDVTDQNHLYRERTSMKNDALYFGDLSLVLKDLQLSDSGNYTCTVRDFERELKVKEVQLYVKVYEVSVDSGEDSVQLLCKTRVHLPRDVTVEWSRNDPQFTKVHVFKKGSDCSEQQDSLYRGRTQMKSGKLCLTLKFPTYEDSGTYTCTVYSREAKVLVQKKVKLQVRVQQVEVDSGVEFVKLPSKTTVPLPEDVTVEWKNSINKVHVYQNGSDQPEKQHSFYRDRTEMNSDLLEAGDLSLILKYPTDKDRSIYTCTIYSRRENIVMRKQVQLQVKDCVVEVQVGEDFIQLPFRSTGNLPEDSRVEWKREQHLDWMIVHMYPNDSDQHVADQGRMKMNPDLLKTGDLSLTLNNPTVRDSGRYFCILQSSTVWRNKTVTLTLKERIKDTSSSKDSLMNNQSV